MKTRVSVFARYISFCVICMLCFNACLFDWNPPDTINVKSLSDAKKKLANYTFCGDSPDDPVDLRVYFNLGDLSQPENNYLRLIEIIGNSGLYVDLKLWEAKMGGGTVFSSPPLNEAVKGMDKIVRIRLPIVTTSIIADTNGKSPFFFYENLVSADQYFSSSSKIAEIGDFAFSFCKSLKGIDLGYNVKTIGKEAIQGCENLKVIMLGPSLESIGDNAFFDCNTLERLEMHGVPPTLGDSVFLGSTPSTLTFFIKKEHESFYRAWLLENASKFNNNGEDVFFNVR